MLLTRPETTVSEGWAAPPRNRGVLSNGDGVGVCLIAQWHLTEGDFSSGFYHPNETYLALVRAFFQALRNPAPPFLYQFAFRSVTFKNSQILRIPKVLRFESYIYERELVLDAHRAMNLG